MSPSRDRSLPGAGGYDADPGAGRHVVLFGLMGSGKSTVGHLVANELGRPFVDSDSIVELRTGHSPPELVDHTSLDHLHAIELAVLHQVLGLRDEVVFAAAASAVDVIGPGDLGTAWSVWLDTSPALLAERVRDDRHVRPLVGERPEALLTDQYERRTPRGRDLVAVSITTDDRTPAETAALICAAWRDQTGR